MNQEEEETNKYKKKSMFYKKWHCGKLRERPGAGEGCRKKEEKDNSDKQQKEKEEKSL